MANNLYKPGEEHRERIVSLFKVLAEKKTGELKKASRGEIEKEILANPGEYPELEALTHSYLRIVISKILNTDPRASPDPTWRKVWILVEGV